MCITSTKTIYTSFYIFYRVWLLMNQIVIEREKDFKIKKKEIPSLVGNQVLIKVHTISICGSDIQIYNGTYEGPKNYPIVFGHEWSGTVVALGPDAYNFEIGDAVTGDCSKYCGRCENCKKDRNMCKRIEKFGITIDGASAEYIIREEEYLYKFNKKIGFEVAALTEPFAVSANLLKKIYSLEKNLSNKKILVTGLGGIGLGTILQLKYVYNCTNISALDTSAKRCKIAETFGTEIINKNILSIDEKNLYSSIYNDNGFDIIIDTTGNEFVFSSLFKLISPFGILGCLGMIKSVSIPQKLLVLKGLRIQGSIGGTGSFEDVLDFFNNNHKQVKKLISHSFNIVNFDHLKSAFEIAQDVNNSLKVQLSFEY